MSLRCRCVRFVCMRELEEIRFVKNHRIFHSPKSARLRLYIGRWLGSLISNSFLIHKPINVFQNFIADFYRQTFYLDDQKDETVSSLSVKMLNWNNKLRICHWAVLNDTPYHHQNVAQAAIHTNPIQKSNERIQQQQPAPTSPCDVMTISPSYNERKPNKTEATTFGGRLFGIYYSIRLV